MNAILVRARSTRYVCINSLSMYDVSQTVCNTSESKTQQYVLWLNVLKLRSSLQQQQLGTGNQCVP